MSPMKKLTSTEAPVASAKAESEKLVVVDDTNLLLPSTEKNLRRWRVEWFDIEWNQLKTDFFLKMGELMGMFYF